MDRCPSLVHAHDPTLHRAVRALEPRVQRAVDYARRFWAGDMMHPHGAVRMRRHRDTVYRHLMAVIALVDHRASRPRNCRVARAAVVVLLGWPDRGTSATSGSFAASSGVAAAVDGFAANSGREPAVAPAAHLENTTP